MITANTAQPLWYAAAPARADHIIAELVPCMAEPTPDKARKAMTTMDEERTRLSSAIDGPTTAREALDRPMDVDRSFLANEAADPRHRTERGAPDPRQKRPASP